MMSDTDTSHSGNVTVADVLDALAPLTQRLDTLAGVSATPAERRAPGRPPDPSAVYVHVHLIPERHPAEADHAAAMLRDAGWNVERELVGGRSDAVVRLTVTADPPDEDVNPGVRGREEQSRLDS